MSISEHPTTLTNLFNTMRYLLTAKQGLTHRVMLGCVILRHRLMMRDQPPLILIVNYYPGNMDNYLVLINTSTPQ